MRRDAIPTKHMPMYLLLALSVVALFVAIAFYLFYSAGKTKLVSPPPNTSQVLPAHRALQKV